MPAHFEDTLFSIHMNQDRDYAVDSDIGTLFNAIQNDSQLGFSLASFIRQAISLRKQWFSGACVRGRLCGIPDHWTRNLLRHPPSDAEFPDGFEHSFTDGKPWFLDPHVYDP